MPVNIPRLVYFENFMNPAAVTVLSGRDDLDLMRLEYAAPVDENLTEMRRAHGYQIQPRTELREPWSILLTIRVSISNPLLLLNLPNTTPTRPAPWA